METESAKSGLPAPERGCLRALPGKLKAKVVKVAKSIKKLGQDDPRRITHSLKVALALTLVSSIYYFRPLYDGFGVSGMWAVLTVVVIFEFTVGATLCKGLNRGFATFLAGALGVGAQHFARLFGEKGEPIVLGLLMFLLAAASTFTRFFPKIKARYDYGIVIFILTFSLVSVSGFRVEKLLELAHQRLSTIIIGGASCMIVSVFVCPVWAGEDLHKLIANNIENLGNYLEGFGSEYFQLSEIEVVSKDEKTFLKGYKSVLNSKSSEESLENFARWEPGHGRFRFRHPWHLYLKAGAQARQCAYQIEALNGCLNSEIQVPQEFRKKIQEPCIKLSAESGKALKELASAIKTMTEPYSANPHLENSKTAVKDLKTALKTAVLEEADILAIMPDAAMASILIEIVLFVEKISESIQEISSLAEFNSIVDQPTATPGKPQLLHRGSVKPVLGGDSAAHVVITVKDCTPTDLAENHEIPRAPPVLHSCRRMEV